jgi:ABC-type transporter Mla subunit MlaD
MPSWRSRPVMLKAVLVWAVLVWAVVVLAVVAEGRKRATIARIVAMASRWARVMDGSL